MIDYIAELFDVEYTCKLLNTNDQERKLERQKKSRPILAKIYTGIWLMSKNMALMANTTMFNAVNYLLNQWDYLRNFILDGRGNYRIT